MPVTASGPLSLPLAGLAALIAACPAFQTAVDADDATEALTHIHFPKVNHLQDTPPTRPWAIITDDDLCAWEIDHYKKCAGSLVLTFQFPSDDQLDVDSAEALLTFTNSVGAIVLEALALANTPGPGGTHYWNAIKFTRLIAPALCDERKESEANEPGELFFEVAFLVDWV